MNAKNAGTTRRIEIEKEIERCLAELRTLGNRNKSRRAVLQQRYAALGDELRTLYA